MHRDTRLGAGMCGAHALAQNHKVSLTKMKEDTMKHYEVQVGVDSSIFHTGAALKFCLKLKLIEKDVNDTYILSKVPWWNN